MVLRPPEALERAAHEFSSRIDPASRTKEIVEFFGSGPERMFGCRILPEGVPIGGLVICSSVHAELINSYRTEVLLARAVAARGIAVQRFHYRGHGHSDGRSGDATFDGMRREALEAAERLRESAGVDVCAFLGTRWGALVAAAAAASVPGTPLVLWEPVMSAAQFFKEALRAKRIRDVREQVAGDSSEHLHAELRSGGTVDVVGYPLEGFFYESAHGHVLVDDLGETPRPVFIAQIGPGKQPRADYRRATERWRALGWPVEVSMVKEQEITWFLPDARSRQESRLPLVDATADWLLTQIRNGSRERRD